MMRGEVGAVLESRYRMARTAWFPRTDWGGLCKIELDALRQYNQEKRRGIAHTPEWEGRMKLLQDRFDEGLRSMSVQE